MLQFLTAGESHGPQLTAILEGFPAGFRIDFDKINFQLARRQKGYGRGGRMKIETDRVQVVSGVRSSVTLGGPIAFVIPNRDWPNWQNIMDPIKPFSRNLNLREKRLAYDTKKPRPGHADLAGAIKWGHYDLRNVLERASARETTARVAICSVPRQLLEHFGIGFASHVVQIADVSLKDGYDISNLERIVKLSELSEVRCIDKKTEARMIAAIKAAKNKRDSVGGVVEVIVRGLPVGLGSFSQWFTRLDGRLAQAMMSIQSVKGVEIGLGFKASSRRGSKVHDEIFYSKKGSPSKKNFYRKTNNAGGLEGGITNGEDIVIRVASKPLSTLNQPLKTVDVKTKKPAVAMVERTDNCVVPALAVICEAMAAFVVCEAFFEKFGSDSFKEIEKNYKNYLKTTF
jgi:chorismate synthase